MLGRITSAISPQGMRVAMLRRSRPKGDRLRRGFAHRQSFMIIVFIYDNILRYIHNNDLRDEHPFTPDISGI